MWRQRIYLDTSVIGGCFDKEFMEWSNKFIKLIIDGSVIGVFSDLTLKELEMAPKQILNLVESIPTKNKELIELDDDSKKLAQLYIHEKACHQKHLADCQHIAIASISGVSALVSWNFKHIVNLQKIRLYNAVNLKYGYNPIEIRTPREVLDE